MINIFDKILFSYKGVAWKYWQMFEDLQID